MSKEIDFIQKIAPYMQKYAEQYGHKICSAAIGQACLESAYGTSNKAKHHNYFGLKYRANRLTSNNGYFIDQSKEQRKNGQYQTIKDKWFNFDSMEMGCKGYYEFVNITNYKNLKTAANPQTYLQYLIKDKYATSQNYIKNVMNVVNKYNLTQYDKKQGVKGKVSSSNSPLVNYTKLSPNNSGKRTHKIDRITPHCVVGQLSVQTLGNMFAQPSKQASCNYDIGSDGRIGLVVNENERSWCSSSEANDQRAVTIECASDKTNPYTFNAKVYASLIKLCIDICKRNGKKKLIWISDKNKALAYQPKSDQMLLTVHRWFKQKACPGQWMMDHMDDLANKVTAALGGAAAASQEKPKSESNKTQTKPTEPTAAKTKTFLVKILTASLNIRSGAGMKYTIQGQVKKNQVFTIVEQKNGWGLLKAYSKNKNGWISLNSAYVQRM